MYFKHNCLFLRCFLTPVAHHVTFHTCKNTKMTLRCLILLQKHLHDTMTKTLCPRISMATPLLSPGTRVTHSGELIRAVVTSAMPPLGAFENDTARVLLCVHCTCACAPLWMQAYLRWRGGVWGWSDIVGQHYVLVVFPWSSIPHLL